MRRLGFILVTLGIFLAWFLADASGGQWSSEVDRQAAGLPASSHSGSSEAVSAAGSEAIAWVPEIPARGALRLCCALGVDMLPSFAGVPIPFIRVGAMLELDQVGRHHYDGGGGSAELLSVINDTFGYSIPDVEQNGLIYACRGGFVDTSHIRELVDWTAFFFSQFDRTLETGGSVELEDEGASRTVISKPVPVELIEKLGRDRVILTMAQWTAYQTSIWHETAQWYGFSIWSLVPEIASGFSPEDPFANAIGIRLLDGVDVREALRSSDDFNRSVDRLMVDAVRELEPLPRSVTIDALKELDGIWWDSEVRLTQKEIVLRREFDIDGELQPWLMPERYASSELSATLEESCGADPEPATLTIPDSLDGVAMREFVRLEIVMDRELADLPAFAGLDRFDQDYFPEMVEKVKAEHLAEFGQGSDRPD